MTINCNSLISQLQQLKLQQILNIHNPQFALLQETRLNAHSNIKILNYTIYKKEPKEGHRGVAVAVREGIQVRQEKADLEEGEALILSYDTGHTKIAICSTYINPKVQNHKTVFENLFKIINGFNTIIIGGDFNTPTSYNSPHTSAFYKQLTAHPQFKLAQPQAPTRGKSILDFFIFKDNSKSFRYTRCVRAQLMSDHHAVILSINSEHIPLPIPTNRHYINYDTHLWPEFNELIELKTNQLDEETYSTTQEIDSAINNITSAINTATELFLKKPASKYDKFAELPPNIIKDLETKAKIQKLKYRQNRRPYPNQTLTSTYDTLLAMINNRLNFAIEKYNADKKHKFLSSLTQSHHVFEDIKRFTNRNSLAIPFLLDENNKLSETHTETCKILRDHFKNIYKKPPNFCKLPKTTLVPSKHQPTNFIEIATIIKNLKNKKSAGPDQISNKIIKKLSFKIICRLAKIYEACIANNYFPKEWKRAKIFLIFKKGNKQIPANYRPISLLSNLGKILEKIIIFRLNKQLKNLDTIPEYQCGFRPGHSTLDAAAILRDSIVEAKTLKEAWGVCLIDIAKAFDSVWHRGLKHKIRKFGISGDLTGIIDSFLSDRKAFITANGVNSADFSINRGVPQGTILGPTLYNVYVSDQPAKRGTILQYADDTALIASDSAAKHVTEKLQIQINSLSKYFTKWGITINGAKSEFVIIGKGSKGNNHLSIEGSKVSPTKTFKYLGIHFNNKNSPAKAIHERVKTAEGALAKLRQILHAQATPQNIKRLTYLMLIRPVLTYGCPLWAHGNTTKVEKFERRILRTITGLHRKENKHHFPIPLLHSKSHIPPITEHIKSLCQNFKLRYTNHKNEYIKSWANTPNQERQHLKFTRDLPT